MGRALEMKRYPDHLVRQARRLASNQDLSYREIATRLNVRGSLISTWCQDLAGSKYIGLIKYNQLKRIQHTDSEKGLVKSIGLDKKHLKLYCALLYGCEGAKYPSSVNISLTKSDPNLIRVFVNLLRKSFDLNEDKWRVHLQIHNGQDFQELVSYWSMLLSISPEKFFKPTVTSPNGKKHRNQYFGTCSVRYYDYTIELKLIGIYEEFLRKLAPLGGVA